MKFLFLATLLLICSSAGLCQTLSREEKLTEIKELSSKIENIVNDLILPAPDDLKQAESSGLNATRLNPRETYGHVTVPQGGGCYFSFTTGSHDYQKTAQLELQGGYLSSGFAGADYGFIGDLGDIPISSVESDMPAVAYLLKYQPAGNILDARAEYRRSQEFTVGDVPFRSRVKVVTGRTYVLRAISFSRADVAVVFRTTRKDTDGSLIIFWKMLAEFPKPTLDPNIKEP